jgi:hypothetical protein
MNASKLYLETTMFSFYYEERTAPPYLEYKAEVRRIFELIKTGVYEPFTSSLATDEIANEPNQTKREKMAALIPKYGVKFLDVTDEARRLASLYVQEGAISPAWATTGERQRTCFPAWACLPRCMSIYPARGN